MAPEGWWRRRRRWRGPLPSLVSSMCLLLSLLVLASRFALSWQQSELAASAHAPPTLLVNGKVTEANDVRPPPDATHQQQRAVYDDGTMNRDDDSNSITSPPPPLSLTTPTPRRPSLLTVFSLSALMAACSGLGALPYLFLPRQKELPGRLRGLAGAAACGVMLAVSFDLIHEGEKAFGKERSDGEKDYSSAWLPTTLGVVFGALFIRAAQRWLAEHETFKWESLGGGGGGGGGIGRRRRSSGNNNSDFFAYQNGAGGGSSKRAAGGAASFLPDPLSSYSDSPRFSSSTSTSTKSQQNQRKNLLVVAIMAAHALAEGSGVGVSFAGERGWSRGVLTTLAIALHNVPEGLATATALASRGVGAKDALYWTLVTAAPQPLVAVPAFVFVDAFRGSALLPGALGFAAGCMIWLVAGELLPDALESCSCGDGEDGSSSSREEVATATVLSAAALEALRMWMALWENEDGSLAPPTMAMMMGKGSGSGDVGRGGKHQQRHLPPPSVVPVSPFATPSSATGPSDLGFVAALASVAAAIVAGGGAGVVVADSTPAGAATLGLASGAMAWASATTLLSEVNKITVSVLVAATLGAAAVAAATAASGGGPAAARAVSAFQEKARLRRRARSSFGADGFASHLAAPVASSSGSASSAAADSSFLPTKATESNGKAGGGEEGLLFKRGAPPPAAVAAAAGCLSLALHEAAVSWAGGWYRHRRLGEGKANSSLSVVAAASLAATRAAFVGGAASTMASLVWGRDRGSRAQASAFLAAVGPVVGLAAAVLSALGLKGGTTSSPLAVAFASGAVLSSACLLLFPVASAAAGPRVAKRTATFGVFAGAVASVAGAFVSSLVRKT